MGVWRRGLNLQRAGAVAASLALHLVVSGALLWANPFGNHPAPMANRVMIDIVTLPPSPPPRPAPATDPAPERPATRQPPPNTQRPPSVPQANAAPAPIEQPANPPPTTDLLVPADPAPTPPEPRGGITSETQRALDSIFCNRMSEDERDLADCPKTAAIPRHLRDTPHETAWAPRQRIDEIHEDQLASAVSTNYVERLLTPQGAPPSLPFAMGPIDNMVFLDRPSEAEMDARAIQDGRRPDWASAVERAHGR